MGIVELAIIRAMSPDNNYASCLNHTNVLLLLHQWSRRHRALVVVGERLSENNNVNIPHLEELV